MASKSIDLIVNDLFSKTFLAFEKGADKCTSSTKKLDDQINKFTKSRDKMSGTQAPNMTGNMQGGNDANAGGGMFDFTSKGVNKQAGDFLSGAMNGLGNGIADLTGSMLLGFGAVKALEVGIGLLKNAISSLQETFEKTIALMDTENRASLMTNDSAVLEKTRAFSDETGRGYNDSVSMVTQLSRAVGSVDDALRLMEAANKYSVAYGADYNNVIGSMLSDFKSGGESILDTFGGSYLGMKGTGITNASKSGDVDYYLSTLEEMALQTGYTIEKFEQMDMTLARTTEKIDNKFGNLMDDISKSWVSTWSVVTESMNNWVSSSGLADTLMGLGEVFAGVMDLVSPIISLLITVFGTITSIIGPVLLGIGELLRMFTKPLGALINAISEGGQLLNNMIDKFFGWIKGSSGESSKVASTAEQTVSVSKINDPVLLEDSSLDKLAELSERQYMTNVNMKSMTPNISMIVNNNNGNLDEEEIVRKIEKRMDNEWAASTNGGGD